MSAPTERQLARQRLTQLGIVYVAVLAACITLCILFPPIILAFLFVALVIVLAAMAR